MRRNLMALAIFMLASGIGLGAFGAHGLESRISEKYINVWETGCKYWIYSSFLIMAVVNFVQHNKNEIISNQLYGKYGLLKLYIFGSILFSISLWLIALNEILSTALKKIGFLTPIGGVMMIVSLVLIVISFTKHNRN